MKHSGGWAYRGYKIIKKEDGVDTNSLRRWRVCEYDGRNWNTLHNDISRSAARMWIDERLA